MLCPGRGQRHGLRELHSVQGPGDRSVARGPVPGAEGAGHGQIAGALLGAIGVAVLHGPRPRGGLRRVSPGLLGADTPAGGTGAPEALDWAYVGDCGAMATAAGAPGPVADVEGRLATCGARQGRSSGSRGCGREARAFMPNLRLAAPRIAPVARPPTVLALSGFTWALRPHASSSSEASHLLAMMGATMEERVGDASHPSCHRGVRPRARSPRQGAPRACRWPPGDPIRCLLAASLDSASREVELAFLPPESLLCWAPPALEARPSSTSAALRALRTPHLGASRPGKTRCTPLPLTCADAC